MEKYKLVFEENFNYEGKLDESIWNYEIGEKWANNESQCYVDDLNNCYVKDGILNIVATMDINDKCKYKSARINTANKKHFLYGKYIIRAKMPKGRGAWPALWMLGEGKLEEVRWPLCGEIDILEFAGNRPNTMSCAIHTKSFNHRLDTDLGTRITLETISDEFHDYELIWTKDSLTFKVDDKEYYKIEKKKSYGFEEWPFDYPYYLIINLAVGGWYGGKIADEDLPYHLQIESIKVYEEEKKIS